LRLKLAALLGRRQAVAPRSLVFFSEGKQYWNCFWPILEELETRQIAAVYWTMDAEDPALKPRCFRHITAQFIGAGYAAFARLNTLQADVCIMTTPGLDVLQIRRSPKVRHYCHIIHALDDCTLYRVFGTDYFDSVLLSGPHQVEALEALEAVRPIAKKEKYIVGCTYLDALRQRWASLRFPQRDTEKFKLRLLIAPSWGPNGLLSKYGMDLLGPLLEEGYSLILRPHPQSKISEAGLLQDLQEQLRFYSGSRLQWDFERENLGAFFASDVMISDFSSVVHDYLILTRKPVFIAEFAFNYDGCDAMDLLPREPWALRAGREVGLSFSDTEMLRERLREYESPNVRAEFQSKIEGLDAYRYPGEAGKRAADCILQIRDSLKTHDSDTAT
ncbi:MAG: CDP-glycerol glycerophosphotransferase family protein, partial [Spirochaetota bacterium]